MATGVGRGRRPGAAGQSLLGTVERFEWRLAGPLLVTFVRALAQRMRLSRARIQELLQDWLGLQLSTVTINHRLHESERAVAPVSHE